MSQSFGGHTISLVVCLWVEPVQEQSELRRRGQIEHVGDGEMVYFQVPAGLLEFLVAHLPSVAAEASAKVFGPSQSEM